MPISPKELEQHNHVLQTREYDHFECSHMNDIIELIDNYLKKEIRLSKINVDESVFNKLNDSRIHSIIKSRIINDVLNNYRNLGWFIKLKSSSSDYGDYYWYEFYTKEYFEQTLSFKMKRFFNNLFK